MIYTNKLGLPKALVKACSPQRHNKEGSLSATTLLNGTKQIILQERHHDEMTSDVSENVFALFGTAVHDVLQNQEDDECFQEEYFEYQITDKTKLTGRVDSYNLEKKKITDFKTTGSFKIQKGDFTDWKNQLMIYAWLMKQNGLEVETIEILAVLKDWSKPKARYEAGYPKGSIQVITWKVTDKDMENAECFIRGKIAEYENCLTMADDDINPCTEFERWARPQKFALHKVGVKKAVKLFDFEEDALKMCETKGKGHYVEHRKGESVRCLDYCSCNTFCNFYLNENNLQKPVEPKVLTSKDLKKHFHDENKRNKNTCDWCLTKTKELTKVASRLFDGENDLVCEDCLRDSEIEQDAFSNEY